jgi:hypothetical protein
VQIKNPKLHAEYVQLAALFRALESKYTCKRDPRRDKFFKFIIELRDRDEPVFPSFQSYSAKRAEREKGENPLMKLRRDCHDPSYARTSGGFEETEADYVHRFLAEHAGETFWQQL